jgi:excisionase family DNA binding protein
MAPETDNELRPLLYSVQEAAHLLGIGTTKVYDLMRTRSLAFVKIGGGTRIELAAIRDFIGENRVDNKRRIPARS